jgi:hypothetical protein
MPFVHAHWGRSGVGISLGMGLGVGLAEALLAGPLLRRHATVWKMFPAFAEVIIPTLGFSYSILALSFSPLIDDVATAGDAQAFFVLCILVWLGILAQAVYMVYRCVTWWIRWPIYLISGTCLLLIALSAYD